MEQTRKKRRRPLPPDFRMTDEHLAFAESLGWDDHRARVEFDRFVYYHAMGGDRFADFDAGWRYWVRCAVKFDGELRDGRPLAKSAVRLH